MHLVKVLTKVNVERCVNAFIAYFTHLYRTFNHSTHAETSEPAAAAACVY